MRVFRGPGRLPIISILPFAALSAGCPAPGTGSGGDTPLYVHAVLAADTDGGNAVEFPLDDLQAMLEGASEIFGEDAGIRFELAGVSRVWSDDVNRLSPDDGNSQCTPDVERAKSAAAEVAGRHEFDGKIVVIFRKFQYVNDEAGGCALIDPSTAFSWKTTPYIAMGSAPWQGADFAHEAGHYLGLPHTFNRTPGSETELVLDVLLAGSPRSWREDLYDGDGIDDTDPDPGVGLYKAVKRVESGCSGSGDISVTIPGIGAQSLRFDRYNVMSYFKGCPKYWSRDDRALLSVGQAEVVWSLLSGSRGVLLSFEPPAEPSIEAGLLETMTAASGPGGADAPLPSGSCAAAPL